MPREWNRAARTQQARERARAPPVGLTEPTRRRRTGCKSHLTIEGAAFIGLGPRGAQGRRGRGEETTTRSWGVAILIPSYSVHILTLYNRAGRRDDPELGFCFPETIFRLASHTQISAFRASQARRSSRATTTRTAIPECVGGHQRRHAEDAGHGGCPRGAPNERGAPHLQPGSRHRRGANIDGNSSEGGGGIAVVYQANQL